ncbi:MAG: beta-ketoacyl-ACP synthase II [Chloroflexi bacterium]|nr:beta-ketoacyl-ACP synthase II [Chloroflexota bacterium]
MRSLLSPPRRVVVTGIGMVTPVGIGREESWRALLAGESGVAPITLFDASEFEAPIAGEVTGFDHGCFLPAKEVRRTDRFAQLALAASLEAVEHAGLDPAAYGDQVGVIIGSGSGGLATLADQYRAMSERGMRGVSPFALPMFLSDMGAAQVSIRLGARGPVFNTVSACASGADAIGTAAEIIRRGDAVAMLAGGAEAGVTRFGFAAFGAARALSTRRAADPEAASRPFDADRDGCVLAEGAATLVLEDMDFARRRGARVLAELAGFGQTADAFHVTQPAEDASGAARAFCIALQRAGLSPSDIGYVNAHGTSTTLNDPLETRALHEAFGPYARSLAISATKSMTGHALGASGAIEAAASVLTLRDRRAHGTRNLDQPDRDCDLDYMAEGARDVDTDAVLSASLAFGGRNTALVFRRLDPADA